MGDTHLLNFADHETVRTYGHYPVNDGNKATSFRHSIRKFDFTETAKRNRWHTNSPRMFTV